MDNLEWKNVQIFDTESSVIQFENSMILWNVIRSAYHIVIHFSVPDYSFRIDGFI